MNAATQGDKALASSDWPAAIQHFTRALLELPRAPPYYIKRSTAYSRLKPADGGPNPQAALRDAETGLLLARERGKRELILTAQMRRGVALYQLERYGDAAFVFGVVREKTGIDVDGKKDSNSKSGDVQSAVAAQQAGGVGGAASRSKDRSYEQELPIWLMKVKAKLDQLPEGDERAAVTVKEYPDELKIPSEEELRKVLNNPPGGKTESGATEKEDTSKKDETATAPSQAPTGADKTKEAALDAVSQDSSSAPFSAGPAAPMGKVRHEWYQSHDSVVITLYVKGVPKDRVDVDMKNDSISIQFPTPSGAEFSFNLDPLFAPIDPSQSRFSVMSTKIEVVLRKQLPGQKWNTLEATTTEKLADRTAISTSSDTTAPAPSTSTTTSDATTEKAPAYPTSSRRGVKDWDKLASELTAKKKKSASKSKGKAKADGDKAADAEESDGAESIDSDYGTGDPVDAFFKKLYANADPDTRRAMVKSYTESQGTALSTNWAEVSKGRVEPRPPSD